MKTKLTILRRQPALVAALLLTNSLSALGDGDLRIDSWTIAGGSTVADGTFSISGTIGHANAGGVSADPAFAVQGGFWAGAAKVVSVQTKTWVGPANGDWYGPTNWSPAGVPGLYDTIIVTSGTVNLTAPVTIGGQFNWSGGTLTGSPLTIASSGVLKINGSGYMNLGGTLTNAGTVNLLGGIPWLQNGAGPVVNLAGGQWNILSDGTRIDANTRTATNASFINAGMLRKTGGSPNGSSSIYVRLDNTGVVSVDQGTFYFEDGGLIGGSFSTASGAVIAFDAGDFTGAGAVLSGPGLFKFSGGTLLLPADIIPNLALTGGTVGLGSGFQGGSITNLTLAGSTLSGANVLAGTFNWNGGTLSGPLTVAGGGTLNINGGGYHNLGGALTNAGTVNWPGSGTPWLQHGAGPVVNLAGGQWNILSDTTYIDASSRTETNACFINAGTLRKTGGSPNGSSSIDLRLDNTGVVSVDQGTLNFGNGGPIGGSFSAASGAVIAFNGGDFIGAGAVLSGSGLFKFSGGTLLLPADIIPNLALTGGTVSLGSGFQGGNIANLTIAGSTLSGANVVAGTFNWNGGTLSGPLTVAGGGTLNINGGGYHNLGGALTNAGTVNWPGSGTPWLQHGAGPVVNLAGGQWNILSDTTYFDASGRTETNACFINGGMLRKMGGSPNGSTSIYIPFYNRGNITVLSGSVNLSGGYTQTGATLNFGLAGVGRPAPLQISGALSLEGTLRASLTNYVPRAGDSIPLVSYGTLVNSFNYLDLPAPGINLGWRVVYSPSPISIQVVTNGSYMAEISGTVRETGGAPVTGLVASAYTTNAGYSVFLSTVTSGSGTYTLNVTNGTWHVGLQGLAARGYAELPGQDVVVNGANRVVDFVVQRSGSPAVACELVAGRILLRWPGTETNWILEATPTLSGNWVPVSQSPVPGGGWTVTLDPSDRASFFRLRKPQ